MGAMAPFFTLLPVPAGGVPTNAAVLATQHYGWTVRVLDEGREIPTLLEGMNQFGAGPGYVVIRPVETWPAGKTLELLATTQSLSPATTVRHVFRTGSGAMIKAPTCAWKGPIAPGPRGPSMPPGMWPTNMPYRPHQNERSFAIPGVDSEGGYLVAARVWLEADGQTTVYEGAIAPASLAEIKLPPVGADDFSDSARIVALELRDMAGNVTHYGSIPTR